MIHAVAGREPEEESGRRKRGRFIVAAAACLFTLVVVATVLWTAGSSPQPLQSNLRFWRGTAHVFLVARGGPLDSAGTRPGDELVALNGRPFASGMSITDAWRELRPGQTARWTVRREGQELELTAVVRAGLSAGSLATVGLAVVILLGVGVGTFILRPAVPETLLFLLFCLSSAINDASTLVSLSGTSWRQRVVTFAYTMTSFFGPALLLHLFLVFPSAGRLQRRLSLLLPPVYAAALGLGLIYYLPTVAPGLTGVLAAPTVHRVASAAFDISVVAAYLACAVSLAGAGTTVESRRVRQQARLLLAGLVLLIVLQIGLWEAPLRLTGTSLIHPGTSALFDLIVPICVAAAIVRHRLFDINILVRYGLVYGLASAGVAAVFVGGVGGLGFLVHRLWPGLDPFMTAGAAAVAALAFTPIRSRVQEIVDRRIYHRRYSYRQEVRETSDRLAGVLDPAAAAAFIRARAETLLEPSWSELFVRSDGCGPWRRLGDEEFEDPHQDVNLLPETEAVVAGKGIPFAPPSLRLGDGRRVALVVPIRESDAVVGVLLLGDKALEAPYLPEDLDLLSTLAGMAGVAVRRGWLIEERALQERLALVGSATSALAHELKNPVAAVKSSAAVLRRRLTGDPRGAELTEIIEREMDRLDGSIADVLSYVRPGRAAAGEVDFAGLVRQLAGLVESEFAAAGVRIEERVDPATPRVHVDPERLRRLLLNLLLNARQAMPEGGAIEVSVCPWRDAEGRELGVELTVVDTGKGFSNEALARAFEPFFTTRKMGTGLGLANVQRIAQEHGGEVTLANRKEGGATVTVRLPRLHAQPDV